MEGGSLRERLGFGSSATVINEDGVDVDFRVESDDHTHTLFVDAGNNAVGIKNSDPHDVSWGADGATNAQLSIGNTSSGSSYGVLHLLGHNTQATKYSIGVGDGIMYLAYDDVAGAHRIKVQSDGDVEIVDGNIIVASGHGIDFSATSNSAATTNSELLDDYEEGTWTPGISTTGNSFASGATQGRYIKIGKQVIATMLINNNSSNTFGSGNFIITGFPYTCTNNNAQVANMAPMIRYVTVPSGAFQLVNYMGANEAQSYFYWAHANNWQVMSGDEINNDTSFAMYAGFVYEATV